MPADPKAIAEEALALADDGRVAPLWNHAGTHYATLARAHLALLADLPHAVETCGCEEVIRDRGMGCEHHWPDEHRAAIARLRVLGGGTP